jgi:hypothetical protein
MSGAKLRPRAFISAGHTNATVQIDQGNKHAACYRQRPSLRKDNPVAKVDSTASRWPQNAPAPYLSFVATTPITGLKSGCFGYIATSSSVEQEDLQKGLIGWLIDSCKLFLQEGSEC